MKNYRFSLRRGIDKIRTGVKDTTCIGVELLKERNPLIQMYFDSEIGSNIETVVEVALASSVCDAILKHLPNNKLTRKLAENIGSFVARKEMWFLDRAKLTYHFKKNRISEINYNRELTRRQATTLITAVDMSKHGLITTIAALSAKIGMDPLTVKGFLEGVLSNIHLSKEKAVQILENGKKQFSKAIDAIDKALETIQDKTAVAYKKTKMFAERIAEKVGQTWETMKTKAKTYLGKTKEVIEDTKEVIEDIEVIVKEILKRKRK